MLIPNWFKQVWLYVKILDRHDQWKLTITQYVCAQKHHNFINGIVYLQHKFKSFLYIFPLKSFGHFVVKKELIYFHKFNPSIPFIDPAIVLTMFMLSLIFLGYNMWIFWWEVNLCRPVFYHLFIHVLPLEIQLFRGEDCDTINWFTPPHCCACPNSSPGFLRLYVVFSFDLCSVS